MISNIWQKVEARTITGSRRFIAKKGDGHQTSFPKLKLPESKRVLVGGGAILLLIFALAYYFLMPVAEVVTVRRGTAISAVYGTVRIEPAFVVRVRAQNDGFIRLADSFSAGRGAIGKGVQRGEKVVSSGNVPAVEYQKSKSEVNRLRGAVETERIERDRNLNSLQETAKKLETEMKNAEVRSQIDGILTNVQTIDGELVSDGNELFTVSSRKTYVRGEVNEEDVGEVKPGMTAKVQLYAYRTRTFAARVTSVQPAADPTTQRYTVVLEMENPPDNMMVGMTGEMNIITGVHENAQLVPTRALLVDQALVVNGGIVQRRTVNVGFRTLDFSEALSGLAEGDHAIIADQDKFHSGQPVRQRMINSPPPPKAP